MTVETSQQHGSPSMAESKGEKGGAAPRLDALSRADERYRSLVLATSSIVWTTDARGAIVEECPTWNAFTGQSFEQYRTFGWLDAIHPDDREHARRTWSEALRTGRLYEVEYRLRHVDGSWRNMLVRGAPVRDQQGQVREWVGTSADITNRVRVEEALREEVRINDVLHQVGMMLSAELDLRKLVQQVTDAATNGIRAQIGAFLCDVPNGKGDPFPLYCVSGVSDAPAADHPMPRGLELQAAASGAQGVIRIDDVTADPRYRDAPPFDGSHFGHPPVRSFMSVPVMTRSRQLVGGLFFGHSEPGVFNARDERIARGIASQAATAIENASLVQEIRESQEHLEQLGGERTLELQVANTQLRASNRELEDFASVASHDLQEPLRKIQAFGDRLEARAGPSLGAEGLDYLHRMRNAAGRMQTLISDLLQFSRITTRAQPFAPVDLKEIASDVLNDLETRIEQTGGSVELGDLCPIDADAMQMRQLLQNLIANALKFRKPSVAPVVQVRSEIDRPAGVCRIYVQDNGIGFDEKYLDRIFNVFQRLHGRGTYEGTGIGLAVCRKIAERHGGSITARSRPGAGSTFIVTLPLRQPRTEENNA